MTGLGGSAAELVARSRHPATAPPRHPANTASQLSFFGPKSRIAVSGWKHRNLTSMIKNNPLKYKDRWMTSRDLKHRRILEIDLSLNYKGSFLP